jgi:uncharacterized protein
MAIGIVIAGSIPVVLIAGDSGLDLTLGSQLVLELGFVGTAFYYAVRNGVGRRRGAVALGLTLPEKPWVRNTIVAFVGYLVFAYLYTTFIAKPEQEDLADDLGFNVSVFGAIASGILIVVVAPIAEEIFFRGFFFGGLRTRVRFAWAAAISGAFFGAVHLSTGDIAVAGQLAALGILLAWLYEEHGSLLPPMCVHLVNNGLAFAVLVST